ncbi:ArsR/SmtB family transcription factor [Hafnia psychrotolerans]|jgi:DNA-binding transcriptional ArsR family regulator|uniref:Transcriptional regulator n=1 Tax=Hafnia psychrotolerans TaxID=1477018 RepID=A0ABQ1GYP9_9GAMM|nr:metalloregulator ArsR/SmtB family transcription factor [Hafnia psychrotolerans]GGA53155.1 transcriptional regulator [Hafnia psychrotolerans]
MTDTELNLLQESATLASKLLKSMSNANRLLILCMLVDSPGTSAGDLSHLTGLSPSATSQHLARMKDEGLIECAREGQKMNYFIKNVAVKTLISTLRDIYCPEDFK